MRRAAAALALLAIAVTCEAAGGPNPQCRMRLDGVEPRTGVAGMRIALIGAWGRQTQAKRAVINAGAVNALQVVDWSPARIEAIVPATLSPGLYRVGVYCDPGDGSGTLYGSGFADFRVLAPAVER